MGGAVGLKGTDGKETQEEAIRKGAKKTAPERAVAALMSLSSLGLEQDFLTCGGEMGKQELDAVGIASEIVYGPSRRRTTRKDTQTALTRFINRGAELVVFTGGDGTARDVLEIVGRKVPIIGIPAGVKMHSAVFVNNPADLGSLLMEFTDGRRTKDAEVMDIDEEAFREGVLRGKLYGLAKVPDDSARMQSSKMVYHSGTADDEAAEIGQYIADQMRPNVPYILGPGSTTAAVAVALGQKKTLLGVDVYLDKKAILLDADERELLELLKSGRKAVIVTTPIGAQGFFFGRGNQQISARVIRRVGTADIVVIATPSKLKGTPSLRVDTGDSQLDTQLSGKAKVVTGYRRRKLVTVA